MGEMKHIWEWVYGRLLKLRGISMRLLERHKASLSQGKRGRLLR